MSEEQRSFQAAIHRCQCKALSHILGAPQHLSVKGFAAINEVKGKSCVLVTEGAILGDHDIHYRVALTMIRNATAWVASKVVVFCGVVGNVPDAQIPDGVTKFNCVDGDPGSLEPVA